MLETVEDLPHDWQEAVARARPVTVRFEAPAQGRQSPAFGPYPYAQLTYDELRAGPGAKLLASYNPDSEAWTLRQGAADETWTDVVVSGHGATAAGQTPPRRGRGARAPALALGLSSNQRPTIAKATLDAHGVAPLTRVAEPAA